MSMFAGITQMGRTTAEAMMTSACTITRTVGESFNEATLQNTPQFLTVYSGPCRLRYPFIRPEALNVADQSLAKERGQLSVPVDTSADILTNDVVTITANNLDPSLVGVTFRVEGPFAQTYATARRFAVEVIA